MKELSIEEKAKRYDEASKEVKDFFEGKQKMYSDVTQTLEYLFPELKESEDEKVYEGIYKDLHTYYMVQKEKFRISDIKEVWDSKWSKAKAWLEKQGEQKSIIIDVDKMVDEFAHTEVKGYGMPAMIEVDAYRKGVNDALRLSLNLEKQSGQRPTDEEMKTILQTEYEKGRADAIAEVQKSAWSKEEKKLMEDKG